MLYAILCYHDQDQVAALTKAEDDALMGALAVVRQKLAAEGKLGPVARLMPTTAATTLREGRESMVIDGPFAETKEQLLGFYVVDCATLEDAIDAARQLAGPRRALGLIGALEILAKTKSVAAEWWVGGVKRFLYGGTQHGEGEPETSGGDPLAQARQVLTNMMLMQDPAFARVARERRVHRGAPAVQHLLVDDHRGRLPDQQAPNRHAHADAHHFEIAVAGRVDEAVAVVVVAVAHLHRGGRHADASRGARDAVRTRERL